MNRPALVSLLFLIATPVVAQDSALQPMDGTEKQNTRYVSVTTPGMILFDSSSDSRKKCAYLIIDSLGKPAVYPAVPNRKPNKVSLLDVKNLWTQGNSESSNVYSSELVGWNSDKKRWNTFKVSLKFDKNSEYTDFRVTGPGIQQTEEWLPVVQMPIGLAPKGSLSKPLPIEMSCIEGPRDTSHGNN
jgi:hypothetical protein